MQLYLDDDLAGPYPAQLLRKAGHDVRLPRELGMDGSPDAAHLRQAVREGRVLITRNYDDFRLLHELVLEAKGSHPGILVVRHDRPSKPFMRPPEIARALAKLAAAGVPVADQYIILNLWR